MEWVFNATVDGKVEWRVLSAEGDAFSTTITTGSYMTVYDSGEVSIHSFLGVPVFMCEGCPKANALYHLLCSKEYQAEVDELRKFVDNLCPGAE